MLANTTTIDREDEPTPTIEDTLSPRMVGTALKRALKELDFEIVGEVEGGFVWESPHGLLYIQSCYGVTQMSHELVFN